MADHDNPSTDDGSGLDADTPLSEQDGYRHVIADDELNESERVIVSIEGREVAVFRVDGELYGLSNYCVHQGGPACEGLQSGTLTVDDDGELAYDFENEIVACPWHGWEFNIKSGAHLASSRYRLPTYEVMVDDGEIYVRM